MGAAALEGRAKAEGYVAEGTHEEKRVREREMVIEIAFHLPQPFFSGP